MTVRTVRGVVQWRKERMSLSCLSANSARKVQVLEVDQMKLMRIAASRRIRVTTRDAAGVWAGVGAAEIARF